MTQRSPRISARRHRRNRKKWRKAQLRILIRKLGEFFRDHTLELAFTDALFPRLIYTKNDPACH